PAIVEESPTFPMDAFIIPEGAARLPRGIDSDPSAIEPPRTPELVDTAPLPLREEPPRLPRGPALREQRAHDVADRLEALAAQLAGVVAGQLGAAEWQPAGRGAHHAARPAGWRGGGTSGAGRGAGREGPEATRPMRERRIGP